MKRMHILALLAAAFSLSACGGGGSSTPNVPSPSSGGLSPSASATFTISIPRTGAKAHARNAKYLTASVQGIDFTVTPVVPSGTATPTPPNNRGYVFYPLTPQSTYCNTSNPSALVCTLAVQAYPGNDLITVNTYDQANPSTPGGNGGISNIVSTGYITANITQGATNPINITTSGVVSNVTMSLDNPYPPTGTPLTQTIHITAADADSYIIIGTYDMPLTLVNRDTSGTVSVDTSAITGSSTVAHVTYNGGTIAPSGAQLVVQTTSTASQQNYGDMIAFATLAPGANGIISTPSMLTFAHANSAAQTVTFSLVPGNPSSPPYSATTNTDVNGDPSCAGIVSVSGSSPTFTITPVKAGTCYLAVQDSAPGNPRQIGYPVTVSP